MRILITGATGFVGGHLAEALLARGGVELFGLCRKTSWPPESAHLAAHVPLLTSDLLDSSQVAAIVAEARPNWVFHLAAYAHPGGSLHEPDLVWRTNLDGTRRLLSALSRADKPRILFVSTGLVYGNADGPCGEDHPLRPATPYAASKAAAEMAAYQATRHPGLDVVCVRPFNHVGPRQTRGYVVPDFASQIAAIEAGRQPPVVETGDLSSQRDLTDVRDMVRAYILLLEKGRTGEVYNCGAGSTVSMQDVLDRLVELAKVRVELRRRAEPRRAAETAVTRADTAKLRRETGWKPQFPLDKTLSDTLNYWRTQPATD
ncbi:MAG: GDP-mannose 4,6-dehydratase [Gemmataceae bacterium]